MCSSNCHSCFSLFNMPLIYTVLTSISPSHAKHSPVSLVQELERVNEELEKEKAKMEAFNTEMRAEYDAIKR